MRVRGVGEKRGSYDECCRAELASQTMWGPWICAFTSRVVGIILLRSVVPTLADATGSICLAQGPGKCCRSAESIHFSVTAAGSELIASVWAHQSR